jgi:enoyl-CoA hydratase/carnithine racemase
VALTTSSDKVLASVEGDLGWIVINNPERHNAMAPEMFEAFGPILGAFQEDPAVRVVIVRGAGDKAFVSGADISRLEGRARSGSRGDAWRPWNEFGKPVIAMIGGYCLGGGLLLALQADLRVAAAGSQFGIPAARIGVGYGYESVQPLLRAMGEPATTDILFTGRRVAAEEALALGLVNRVVPQDGLEQEVRSLAATIAANAPLTIRACKAAIRESRRPSGERDLAKVAALVQQCVDSDDFAEGRQAFLEHRPPAFRGT